MINTEEKQYLLDILQKVKITIPIPEVGICSNIRWYSPIRYRNSWLYPYFESWSEYSGNEVYPVPAPQDTGFTSTEYYEDVSEDKWEGEYGEARLRLLDHIISELEKELSGNG